jgi:hypothetical protein
VRIGIVKKCIPDVACVNTVIEQFRKDFGLENYPEEIMLKSGWKDKDTVNGTVAKNGLFSALSNGNEIIIRDDAREAIAEEMMKDPPPMDKLLLRVMEQCPQVASKAATESGVTIYLGFHYEISLLLPKFFNSWYFAIGTADLDVQTDFDPFQNKSDVNYSVNASLFSDACGGVGPDIGFQLGGMGGLALTVRLQCTAFSVKSTEL